MQSTSMQRSQRSVCPAETGKPAERGDASVGKQTRRMEVEGGVGGSWLVADSLKPLCARARVDSRRCACDARRPSV